MIINIGTIWIGFLITWFFLLIIRIRLNYIIRKKQQQQSQIPIKPKSNATIFFLSIFILYNKPSKFEEPGFRRTKIRTNLLHLLFMYGFIAMCIFSFIAFVVNDLSRYDRQQNSMNHQ